MIAYFIESSIAAACFWLIYRIILSQTATYRFNRFFLLTGLTTAVIVPFIRVPVMLPVDPNALPSWPTLSYDVQAMRTVVPNPGSGSADLISADLMVAVYLVLCLVMAVRFIRNLLMIFKATRNGEKLVFPDHTLILQAGPVLPHSFLHFIFLNRQEWEHESSMPAIIAHECTHVKQKHSLDLLFIEWVMVFCSLNPVLYLFRKSVIQNHEFLADQGAIRKYNDSTLYQQLLLNYSSGGRYITLGSQFGYSIIKKRIKMMSKNVSTQKTHLRTISAVLLFITTVLAFNMQTIAQKKTANSPENNVENGLSENQLKEFDALVADLGELPASLLNDNKAEGRRRFFIMDRMSFLFRLMNDEQISSRNPVGKLTFYDNGKGPQRRRPAKSELEYWSKTLKVLVKIDDKTVVNAELSKYTPEDFPVYFYSKLSDRKNVTHNYQLLLYTNQYYNANFGSGKL